VHEKGSTDLWIAFSCFELLLPQKERKDGVGGVALGCCCLVDDQSKREEKKGGRNKQQWGNTYLCFDFPWRMEL